MENVESYTVLAHELIEGIARLGHQLTPMARNSLHGEMAVMRTLDKAEGALAPGELAEASHVSSARVANILRSLEKKRWVTRQHSLIDRRRVTVSLTDQGNSVCRQRKAERDRALAGFLGELGEKDATELVRIVRRSCDIVEAHGRKGSPLV